jgi:hypothetical protein
LELSARPTTIRFVRLTSQHCSNVAASEPPWPRPAFTVVPPLPQVGDVAREVRRRLVADDKHLDIRWCAHLARATVRETTLDGAAGGCQGLLSPMGGDRFRISVDPVPRGGWRAIAEPRQSELARHRTRFLVAHELAHTLFYRRDGEMPRRAAPGGTVAEEEFCDAFARHLLIPRPPGGLTADVVVDRHERYDVSLELAARGSSSTEAAVVLWRWDAAVGGRRAALHLQWASEGTAPRRSDVVPYRTDPVDLPRLFAKARRRLGEGFSAVVLPGRRQALMVLR